MGGAEAKKATETTAAAKPAAADKKAGAAKGKDNGVKERQTFERQRGSQWTLERCRKYARRYKSEVEWIAGSPASYKAATYWNWVDQCCEHMPTGLRVVHGAGTATSTARRTKKDFTVVPGHKSHDHGTHDHHSHAGHAHAGHSHPGTHEASNVHKLEKKTKTTTKPSTGRKKKAS